jgi:hypothetical protein
MWELFGSVMKYKDYLKAARKHEYTCDVIYDKIASNTCNAEIKKSLLLNMYYISGYTIECIVKYGIYDLAGYDKDKDVKKLDTGRLKYETNIKHHKFERYTEHLIRYISRPIPLISDKVGVDKEVIDLYKAWDAEVRYSYDMGTKQDIHFITFYRYSKQILRIVRDNVRG